MTKVVILQSSYIPWKGYFDLINDADIFVFFDDVQFTSRDWRSRNKYKTKDGSKWLTVPVGSNRGKLINEITIPDRHWQKKHFKSLVSSYSTCKYFGSYLYILERFYIDNQWSSLHKMNQFIIKELAALLGISTKFIDSSSIKSDGKNQYKLLDIAKSLNASEYISGPSAKSYINKEVFESENIQVTWKDYSNYPEYMQIHPPYDPYVTILDLIFHVGHQNAPDYIWQQDYRKTS